MKYAPGRKASEEMLRLIIQRMAIHPAAFTPHAYAVWYEYLMGGNSGLSREMDRLLGDGCHLDDETVTLLYQDCISESGREGRRIHEEIRKVLAKILDATRETGRHTESFGSSLEGYGSRLRAGPAEEVLEGLLKKMVGETEVMRGSAASLNCELERSKDEIGKLQRELDSARQEALIDPLTGIFNRRGFEVKAGKAIAESVAAGQAVCVLMADIDHFKRVNDTYGHLFGDKVICAIANTLRSRVRGQDLVARLGGEEFAVLLPDTSVEGACAVAEHIRSGIEKGRIRGAGMAVQQGSVTVSIGIAGDHQGSSLAGFLELADKALYASKKQGRNRITVYGERARLAD